MFDLRKLNLRLNKKYECWSLNLTGSYTIVQPVDIANVFNAVFPQLEKICPNELVLTKLDHFMVDHFLMEHRKISSVSNQYENGIQRRNRRRNLEYYK